APRCSSSACSAPACSSPRRRARSSGWTERAAPPGRPLGPTIGTKGITLSRVTDVPRDTDVLEAPATLGGRIAGTPAYQVLADGLRAQITSGKLRPGDRLPTEPQLCAQSGLSRSTVREA